MTKDQEAIKKLTNGEKIDFNTLIRKFKKEGIENFVVTKKEYIETVLSMLKENSAELAEKSAEIEKKDKIIDLMADFMYKTGTGRRALSCMFRQNDECNENGCKYCIKKYFERKVKND